MPFAKELEALVLRQNNLGYRRREEALNCLLADPNYDPLLLYDKLIELSEYNRIKLAGEIVIARPHLVHDRSRIEALFDKLCIAYPRHDERNFSTGSTFFIRKLISGMDDIELEAHLDRLRMGLKCSCGAKERYECHCLEGRSKIMGRLLDQYCQISPESLSPEKFVHWTKDLVFRKLSAKNSRSVRLLSENAEFRRAVQWLRLGVCRTSTEARQRHDEFLPWGRHFGWFFDPDDRVAIVERAFSENNIPLWSQFFIGNSYYNRSTGPVAIRKTMRRHAAEKPDFMRAWASLNNNTRQRNDALYREDHRHRDRYHRRKRRVTEQSNADLVANEPLIRADRHWGWLIDFAQLYLWEEEAEENQYFNPPDPDFVEDALVNCPAFIANAVPSLEELAELGLRGKSLYIERVLSASALASYRRNGSLSNWSLDALMVVRANMSYFDKSSTKNDLTNELNRLLFQTPKDREVFLRRCIAPQLASHHNRIPDVYWLSDDETFADFRASLPLEWLFVFPQMPDSALKQLFDLAAAHSSIGDITKLVELRCAELSQLPNSIDDERLKWQREFWFVRGFLFAFEKTKHAWEMFFTEAETIFLFQRIFGFNGDKRPAGWPSLNAHQISWLLLTYIDAWPKVPLPSGYGTYSPKEEKAYLFIGNLCAFFGHCDAGEAIEKIDALLDDQRFNNLRPRLLNTRALKRRALNHAGFTPPSPETVMDFLNKNLVATAEDFRAHIVDELTRLESRLRKGETTPLDAYYKSDGTHITENDARNRLVERLKDRFDVLDATIQIEHHMVNETRCDITFSKSINGEQKLIVVEVKGQWHAELFSAASDQLYSRYACHPDADDQGIYLVLWFGSHVSVAGKKRTDIKSASDLQKAIEAELSDDLKTRIDVVVLDLSRYPAISR